VGIFFGHVDVHKESRMANGDVSKPVCAKLCLLQPIDGDFESERVGEGVYKDAEVG
jgi:hypothetical protein